MTFAEPIPISSTRRPRFASATTFRDLLDEEDLARGPVVVVSRDMRSHSIPMARALKDGLRARGVAVIDIGVADTPQNYFGIGFLGASGGIQVTASHNPAVYNGFKMSRRDAIPVSYETGIDRLERSGDSPPMSPPICRHRRERRSGRSSTSTPTTCSQR